MTVAQAPTKAAGSVSVTRHVQHNTARSATPVHHAIQHSTAESLGAALRIRSRDSILVQRMPGVPVDMVKAAGDALSRHVLRELRQAYRIETKNADILYFHFSRMRHGAALHISEVLTAPIQVSSSARILSIEKKVLSHMGELDHKEDGELEIKLKALVATLPLPSGQDAFPVKQGVLNIPATAADTAIDAAVANPHYDQVLVVCGAWDDRERTLAVCRRILAIQRERGIKKWEPVIVSVADASLQQQSDLLRYFGDNGLPATELSYRLYVAA